MLTWLLPLPAQPAPPPPPTPPPLVAPPSTPKRAKKVERKKKNRPARKKRKPVENPPPVAEPTTPANESSTGDPAEARSSAEAEPAPPSMVPAPAGAAQPSADRPSAKTGPDPVLTIIKIEADNPKASKAIRLPSRSMGPEPVLATLPLIKGDLIYPGTRRIMSRFDHAGVSIGPSVVDSDLYLSVAPGFAWVFDNGVALSAHIPLRFLALRSGSLDFGGMRLRTEDWDEVADFAKVLRYVTLGRKEENLYATLSTLRPSTLGHGMLLNRYQGDMDVDRSLTSFSFDAYNRYAGFQLLANDITFQNQLVGGLVFLKPLSFLGEGPYFEGVSIGGEFVADFGAPRCVRLHENTDTCVRAAGHQAGLDPFDGSSLDGTFVRTTSTGGRFAVQRQGVQALGASFEAKVYRHKQAVDVKVYGTYHRFLNPGGGAGLSTGTLMRLTFGGNHRSAIRLRAEYRSFTDGFLPQYFDSFYEVQKYAYLYRSRQYQVTPTKAQAIFGDPANGFQRSALGRRHGYRFDGSWGLFGDSRSKKKLALGLGIQDSSGPDDTNFYAHIEFPALGVVQVFATYMRNNLPATSRIFVEPLTANDSILLSGLRLQVLPFLFINAHYSRAFRVTRTPGSEYRLGNDTIRTPQGGKDPFFQQDRLFETVQTVFAEIELGLEFSDD